MSHNFPVNRENTFTAKEAVNLLEGRSVKIEFLNPKTDQKEPAFVRFDFSEPKTEKGNYKFQNFYKTMVLILLRLSKNPTWYLINQSIKTALSNPWKKGI